jgi:hypothetical protein
MRGADLQLMTVMVRRASSSMVRKRRSCPRSHSDDSAPTTIQRCLFSLFIAANFFILPGRCQRLVTAAWPPA